MLTLQEEKFHPSQGVSFDITIYNTLTIENPDAFRIHEDYELTFLVNCSGKRIVGNGVQNFYEEDLFILGPNLPHLIIVDNPESSKAICIHFTENSFGEIFFQMPQNANILKLLSRASLGLNFYGTEVQDIKEKMKIISQLEPFDKMISLLTILQKLSKTKNYSVLTSPGYQPTLKRKDTKRMSMIYNYIMENFQKKITLEELSSLINVSPATFNRLFKKSMNKNFSDFIVEVRIGHACKLLMDTDLSISEICYLSGYNYMTHFNSQFKQLMEKTPREYRSGFQ